MSRAYCLYLTATSELTALNYLNHFMVFCSLRRPGELRLRMRTGATRPYGRLIPEVEACGNVGTHNRINWLG